MATSSCSPVTCVGARTDAFFFQVVAAESDVVEDSFKMSKCSSVGCWVQNQQNKFLLLNSEQQFQVKNLTHEQRRQPECKFKIHMYTDFERGGTEGKAVMLYMKNEGKNMVACCRHETEVYPEEMEALPSRIEDTEHKALFFMTKLSPSNTYQFESSVFPSRFLGFEADGDDPSLDKLVLRRKGRDQVDAVSCQVILL